MDQWVVEEERPFRRITAGTAMAVGAITVVVMVAVMAAVMAEAAAIMETRAVPMVITPPLHLPLETHTTKVITAIKAMGVATGAELTKLLPNVTHTAPRRIRLLMEPLMEVAVAMALHMVVEEVVMLLHMAVMAVTTVGILRMVATAVVVEATHRLRNLVLPMVVMVSHSSKTMEQHSSKTMEHHSNRIMEHHRAVTMDTTPRQQQQLLMAVMVKATPHSKILTAALLLPLLRHLAHPSPSAFATVVHRHQVQAVVADVVTNKKNGPFTLYH
jgi:hypothetical protein